MPRKKKLKVVPLPGPLLSSQILLRTCFACEQMTHTVEIDYGYSGCDCCATSPSLDTQISCSRRIFDPMYSTSDFNDATEEFRAMLRVAPRCPHFTPVQTLTDEEVELYGCERI